MQNKILCSVGILTFNSEETLKRTLESVKDFAEIIICDGCSTDNTLEIAKEYGCKIILQDSKFKNSDNSIKNFGGIRNQCLDAATYNWFLYIDSDETISKGLKEKIENIINSNSDIYIYNVPIKIIIDGKLIKHSSNYPGYQHRFFNKKSGAKFIKEVHERIDYNKDKYKVHNLKNPWYVFWDKEYVDNYFKKTEKYVKIEVERNKNQTFFNYLQYGIYWNFKAILKILIKSLRNYILYGFKESMPIKIELARIIYLLKLVYFLTLDQFKKYV